MSPETEFEVTSTAKVTLEELGEILSDAVEQGIGYWAEVRNYRWDNVPMVTADIREFDQKSAEKPGWHTVTAMDMLRILPTIKDHSGQAKDWDIRELVESYDSEVSDIAVQLAIFGEVIYG